MSAAAASEAAEGVSLFKRGVLSCGENQIVKNGRIVRVIVAFRVECEKVSLGLTGRHGDLVREVSLREVDRSSTRGVRKGRYGEGATENEEANTRETHIWFFGFCVCFVILVKVVSVFFSTQ